MRRVLASCIVVFVVFISACASLSKNNNDDYQTDLLITAQAELYRNFYLKNYEAVYEMTAPSLRRTINKVEYVAKLEAFLTQFEYITYSRSEVLIYREDRYAVTQSWVMLQRKGPMAGPKSDYTCERTIWVWKNGSWYFAETNLLCTYLPDEKRLEFLSR